MGTRNFDHADRLVEKTLEIVKFYDPPVWWIENPRLGKLKSREFMQNLPYIDVDYCQFSGWGCQKPTRIWCCESISKLPNKLCDGKTCPNLQPNSRLGGLNMQFSPLQRSRMPAKLVDYLLQNPPTPHAMKVRKKMLQESDFFMVVKVTKYGSDLQLAMFLKVHNPEGGLKL